MVDENLLFESDSSSSFENKNLLQNNLAYKTRHGLLRVCAGRALGFVPTVGWYGAEGTHSTSSSLSLGIYGSPCKASGLDLG